MAGGPGPGRRQQTGTRRAEQPPPGGRAGSLTAREFLVYGFVVGVGAFLLVFGATLGLLLVDIGISDIDPDEFGEPDDVDTEDSPGLLNPSGWWFFSSHFVEVDGGPVSIDLVEFTTSVVGLTFPSLVYRLVPVVTLVATGYLFAKRVAARTDRPPAAVGASICLGYLPMCVLGVFLFSWSTTVEGFDISVTVQLPEAIIFAGVLYPVLCGGLGGLLAGRRDGRPERPNRRAESTARHRRR